MRRWLTAVAVSGVAAMLLAGCGKPGGVDGDLLDDWTAIAEPTVFTPQANTCHPRFEEVGYLSAYKPVDCAQSHQVETVHLGSFTGEDANRTSPPPTGSPEIRKARGECEQKANEVLGADWRGGRLSLAVVLPSTFAWEGGARWFRCDLSEVKSLDDADLVDRTGTFKGALAGSSPLAHGCFSPKVAGDDIDEMTPISCTAKHRAEFVGVWVAPDTTYSGFEKNSDRTHQECLRMIASYAKVPNNSELKYRAGSIFYYPKQDEWENGNRGIQCFLWVSNRDLTRSMKGAGAKGLPVR